MTSINYRPIGAGIWGLVFLALSWALSGGGLGQAAGTGPEPATKTKYLGWYDVGPPHNQYGYWAAARRTSNLVYMRVARNEFADLIPKAQAEGWKGVILAGHEREHARTAEAARAIVRAGLNLVAIIYSDEPDLAAPILRNQNMTQHLTHHYNALKAELKARGLDQIPIGATWSLAAIPPWTWKRRLERFGTPPQDVFITDSWYSGKDDELHLVRQRTVDWLDYMKSKLGPKPIIHVIKAWSRVPPDLQEIHPEWVLRQLKCVTGTGSSTYRWQNPRTKDVAQVTVQPLEAKYQGLAVLMYKMDPTRNQDTQSAGGNQPEIIKAVASYAKPRGWTMD
ncbi:MAG: hypothetical protein JRJ59_05040 [Deltaproteobacteria bacterium]|nr:hypothetical protein [Deltaproteobacteria bacterium]